MANGTERQVSAPIVVLRGVERLKLVQLPVLLLVGLPLSMTVPALLAVAVGRNAPPPQVGPIGTASWPGVFMLSAAVVAVLTVGLEVWARARRRTVEVFADRLVAGDVGWVRVVFLADLDTFDDTSSELVTVRRRGGWLERAELTVYAPPGAPPADGRATLIDALLAAGLRREDGAPLPPRSRDTTTTSTPLEARGRPPIPEAAACLATLALLALGHAAHGEALRSTWLGPVGWIVEGPQVLAVLLPVLVTSLMLSPRRGHVTLFVDRVRFGRAGVLERAPEVAYDDLVGWQGSARAYVRLVTRAGFVRDALAGPTIPTPTPALRTQVEAVLTARGVPRL